MASANSRTEKDAKVIESNAEAGDYSTEGNLPAVKPQGALTVGEFDFAADAGGGMEGATFDSFAIPFLIILQKGSPQCDEASGKAIPGARQGMFYNTVTGKLYDTSEKPLVFVPCAYKRTFIHWGARAAGGKFKGELTEQDVIELRRTNQLREFEMKLLFPLPNGDISEKMSDRVSDTRNHYGFILEDDGSWQQALMSLASSQIKHSRNLMAQLGSQKIRGQNGLMFQPPTWANKVYITSIPEKNDKGTWMGFNFHIPEGPAGKVDRRDVYDAGKEFSQSVKQGSVTTNYQNLEENQPREDESVASGPIGPGAGENKF